jgi:ABC-2 type transport system permease protein
VRLFGHQLRCEQLVFWRSREAAIFIFVFPLLLFLLLGSVYSGRINGHRASEYLLAGMIGYGAANTAFAGLAITLVNRREAGMLKRIRSTPLPSPVYLSAVLVSTLLVFALQTLALFALGRVLFDTHLPTDVGSLVVAVIIGAGAFAALGLAMASVIRSAEGSSAVVQTVLLPMAFLAGSFGPTRRYPAVLQAIGDVLPLKYFLDIVDAIVLSGRRVWSEPEAIAVLAAWAAFGIAVALRRFRWEPREG